MATVEIKGLVKTFGKTEVLHGIDLAIEDGEFVVFVGPSGCGKSTIARALCSELDTEYIMINCSEDGNIDTLRTKIRNFASTVSLTGAKKVVIFLK